MKIVFASNNQNKIREIQNKLPNTIQLIGLKDINCNEDIPETSHTIEGNAILKANYITQKYGIDCFADDSGLEIEALNGQPGVYSARYAGDEKNDEKNIELVLQKLNGVENRKAQFKTIIALNINGKQHIFQGIVKGKITTEKRGNNGFGYDPIFIPDGYDKTFAQMSLNEKANISHRTIAVEKLIDLLK